MFTQLIIPGVMLLEKVVGLMNVEYLRKLNIDGYLDMWGNNWKGLLSRHPFQLNALLLNCMTSLPTVQHSSVRHLNCSCECGVGAGRPRIAGAFKTPLIFGSFERISYM